MNNEIAVVPRRNKPCIEPEICRALIGKGDHQIESVVMLYSLGGKEFDLIKIQFFVKSTLMIVGGTSETRIYLDSDRMEQEAFFVSGLKNCPQTFCARVRYVPEIGTTNGRVFVQGILTDRFGMSPQSLTYTIAAWAGFATDCKDGTKVMHPEPYNKECGLLRFHIDIRQDIPNGMFNVAEVSLIDITSNTGMVRDYKQGSQDIETLILFNQNIQEHNILLCPENGIGSTSIVQLVWIRTLGLILPKTDSCGSLCIEGMYMAHNRWHIIQPQVLLSWYHNDGIECKANKRRHER